MTDRSYETRFEDRQERTGNFGRWLSTRPAESWMFFVAGVFLGGFFF